MNEYRIRKVSVFNISAMLKISAILYDCGKDMASKYALHHWDNGKLKSFLVAVYSSLKSDAFLVEDTNNNCIATFQTKKADESLHFGKLATRPQYAGKGVGSFCIKTIEQQAKDMGCKRICMEVYDRSKHAMDFYLHKGYVPFGEQKTLKYTQIKMQKLIGEE